jgi:hypothetical protein
MIGEIDIAGVFVPALLIWILIAVVLGMIMRTAMVRLHLYRFIWHRGLFDVCLQVVLLAAVTRLAAQGGQP